MHLKETGQVKAMFTQQDKVPTEGCYPLSRPARATDYWDHEDITRSAIQSSIESDTICAKYLRKKSRHKWTQLGLSECRNRVTESNKLVPSLAEDAFILTICTTTTCCRCHRVVFSYAPSITSLSRPG